MQVTGWTTVLRFTRRGDRSLSQRRSLPQTSLSVEPTKHIMLKKKHLNVKSLSWQEFLISFEDCINLLKFSIMP